MRATRCSRRSTSGEGASAAAWPGGDEGRRQSRRDRDVQPPPFTPTPPPLASALLRRVRAKLPMQALDNTRYRLDPPPQTKRGDLGAWKAALDNANSQLEHQYLRILNQELLLKHGDKVWRAQGQLDDALVKGLEAQLAATKKETDALNRERKLQQMAAGGWAGGGGQGEASA